MNRSNIIIDRHNHLFELARSGKRLPHVLLAVGLSLAFILLAQFTGGAVATALIILLSVSNDQVSAERLPEILGGGDSQALMNLLLPDTALEQAILLILAFGPIFLILWAWVAWFERRPFWTIGLERSGAIKKYVRGLLVGLVMFGAAIGLSAMLGFVAVERDNVQPQGVVALGGISLVLLGWVVQGAAEEALTRGWLLPVIGARYNPALGIVISALLFAFFHLLNPNVSLIAVLNLALFGLFTALYALYEKGLWGVFSIHTVWNWAQGNLFGFQVSGQTAPGGTLFDLMEVGPDIITGGPFGPEGGLSVTLVLAVACAVVWGLGRRAA